ncbi:MAG: hypothetical protein VZR54_08640 [Ruminococcus sp.]|nr:hypothetical protein [Ruminococcus sp.]
MRFPPDLYKKYGDSVTVISDGRAKETKAFFQSLRRKYQNYSVSKRHLAGLFTKDHYLLITPADVQIKTGDTVTRCGKAYVVLAADYYSVKDKALYAWAVLTARAEFAEDDYFD